MILGLCMVYSQLIFHNVLYLSNLDKYLGCFQLFFIRDNTIVGLFLHITLKIIKNYIFRMNNR